jgi:hypothetical protein
MGRTIGIDYFVSVSSKVLSPDHVVEVKEDGGWRMDMDILSLE